jgi:hypothetical protein
LRTRRANWPILAVLLMLFLPGLRLLLPRGPVIVVARLLRRTRQRQSGTDPQCDHASSELDS